MSPERYIRHVTLSTGHVRDSYRHEISAQALAVCADLLTAIVAGETVRIPGVVEYYLSGRAGGGCLLAMVWPERSAPSLTDRRGYAPIITIGIAAHSRCGARLWRELHRWGELPVLTDPSDCPPEPWVAAALDAGILHYPEAAHWLGDFERCLAWAWYIRWHQPDQER